MAENFVKNFVDTISKAFRVDPSRGTPIPRKGLFQFTNTLIDKKQAKPILINSETLRRLANTDPITWAIRRTIKGYISGVKWDIVPDTQKIEAELDRWEDIILTYINPYGFDTPDFESKILTCELQEEVRYKLDVILEDMTIDDTAKRDRVRWLFKSITKKVRNEAESHKHEVKAIFEHPNNTESSFRVFTEILLDDLLVHDAGVVVKNYTYGGQLAELYTIPGNEVKIYRNEDGTAPEAPEPAYVWEEKGIQRAEFTNDELIYMMQNPQHNGYGMSPLEVAAYVITASLYADEYNIDYFKHSNVPPGIIDLGENVTEDQRKIFARMWEQEVQGRAGQHKLVFTNGSKVNFVPMRVQTSRDMQMMEYLKWTAAIKCACYGISPQDIGFVLDFHRTTAEVQEKLSKTRGVNTILNLMQSYFNEEIVKCEFGFQDVKFEWQTDDSKDSIQQAQVDKIDIDTGVISINERRKRLGLKPIEGGDEYTIKGGNAMTPVSDLGKLDEQKLGELVVDPATGQLVPKEQMQQQQVDEFGNPIPTDPNADPTVDPTQEVNGDPGRLTTSEQEEKDQEINLKVNGSKPKTTQRELLNKTVEQLKKSGINATLKIGFDNETNKPA